MNDRKAIEFPGSFSNSKFELYRLSDKVVLKKKIKRPNYRDFESLKKNNLLINVLKIKNLNIQKISVKSYRDFVKRKSYLTTYVNGLSGELIILNSSLKEINLIKNYLNLHFKILMKNNKFVNIDQNIFLNKLREIEKKTLSLDLKIFLKKNKNIMKKYINNISTYPSGICHGDLTLSNFIINKNQIYLIDFLKTYHDSILQDLSKIYQEFILGWSSRFTSKNQKLRSKLFCEKVVDVDFFNSFPINLRKYLYFEILMTLFRIFPYVKQKDKITINWLKDSIKFVIKNNIKF